jgi:chromate transport protein ChrA
MTAVTITRLAIAAIGIAVWVMGYRLDDDRLRWAGMLFLVVAIVLRFLERSRGRGRDDESTG